MTTHRCHSGFMARLAARLAICGDVRAAIRSAIRVALRGVRRSVLAGTLLVLLAQSAQAGLFTREWTWPRVLTLVRERFADVTHISTAELERRLQLAAPARPLLLDARTAEEFAASHLNEARPAFTEAMALSALAGSGNAQPVVVYCSVGYRSAELARKLAARGYTNVVNLEGSLFAWANEGRPVYAGGQLASRVHPYDSAWGALLRPGGAKGPSPQCTINTGSAMVCSTLRAPSSLSSM